MWKCGIWTTWAKMTLLITQKKLLHNRAAAIFYTQTPYLAVATGTPGPIVEVTVQDLR